MKTFVLIYNRLTQQGIGPTVAPATVTGENPRAALKSTFGYAFRRVYDEAAKSPDVVVVEGTVNEDGTIHRTKRAATMRFIAVCKSNSEVKKREDCRKEKDPRTHRFIRRKN